MLLTRPGQLTEEAIVGIGVQRPRPLFLFLVCSFAYFVSVPLVNRISRASPSDASAVVSDPQAIDGALSAIESQASESAVIGALWTRLGRDRVRRIIADPTPLSDAVANTFTAAMFLLMPLFAALTWVVWNSAATTFRVHLWFAAHLHAAWFAALVAAQLGSLTGSSVLDVLVGAAVLIYSTWYASVAMRRVLGGSNAEFLLRSTLVGMAYVIALFVLVCGLLFVAVMRL